MRAEERQLGVRDRVDVGANELGALGPQLQVGAAERDDPRIGRRPGGDREPVGPRAGADARRARAWVLPRGVREHH